MGQRLQLQQTLEQMLGSRNVYFQPPETIKMAYPCIVYDLTKVDADHADDAKYRLLKRYTVTLITRDAEPSTFYDILALPYCSHDRTFCADGLYHFTFRLYF